MSIITKLHCIPKNDQRIITVLASANQHIFAANDAQDLGWFHYIDKRFLDSIIFRISQ